MISIAFREGLKLPAELTLLAKALFNLDAVTSALDPNFNPTQDGGKQERPAHQPGLSHNSNARFLSELVALLVPHFHRAEIPGADRSFDLGSIAGNYDDHVVWSEPA